jgi:hypothetical protein
MSQEIEVAQVVAMIGSAYPNFNPAKETVAVYYELLKDLPFDLLKAAALKCCAESGRKFAPSVGEIRGAAIELQVRVKGIPSVLAAWDEVCTAPYRQVNETHAFWRDGIRHTTDPDAHKWSHPLVEKVARMMGWPEFPDPESESTDRAHFFKQYEAEIARYSSNEIELPEVTRYIETQRGKALPIGEVIKQLPKGKS